MTGQTSRDPTSVSYLQQQTQTWSRREASWGAGLGNGKLTLTGCGVSFWDNEKGLEMDGGQGCMTL